MLRATYRLQLQEGLGFDGAAKLAPYLADLGVSHVYTSSFLRARPGSTHGYDVVDHGALDPSLGDARSFREMVETFHRFGLGLILDFVPNHMGIGGDANWRWLDVLRWGRDSAYAFWFDIEWDSDKKYLQDKVLVPILGGSSGDELSAGHLRLRYDETDGTFSVWAYDVHRFPICPESYPRLLEGDDPEITRLRNAFAELPNWKPKMPRRAQELCDDLRATARANPRVARELEAILARWNGKTDAHESSPPLASLLDEQRFRLASFRTAADDVNYRRFFDVSDLAGLRMEFPDVFDETHALVLSWLADGTLDGLRIDHIDGLADPKGYLLRLREEAGPSPYLVVEKILGEGESLPAEWPVEGTTGYDSLNLLTGILLDPNAEKRIDQIYVAWTGETRSFEEIVHASKLRILENEMASELHALARDAERIAQLATPRSDLTENQVSRALREIIAWMPVYRTYVDATSPLTSSDREALSRAVGLAKAEANANGAAIDLIDKLMTGDWLHDSPPGVDRASVLRFAERAQQVSGPMMAKGLEDTAFYRYDRFLALNEVGGAPARFGISLADFHRANELRQKHFPRTMLATSTHDTKRGEDARARLVALAEVPDEWQERISVWSKILRGDDLLPSAPDANDEYLVYQTLLGSWPEELLYEPEKKSDAVDVYRERIKGAVTKGLREAKVHSTWASPSSDYENAMFTLVDRALSTPLSPTFLAAFLPFVRTIARLGASNSLTQTVLHLTMPGAPDLYRGSELLNLSLVDPDNRRPIDFGQCQASLARVKSALGEDRLGFFRDSFAQRHTADVKLATILSILAFRRENATLFKQGSYAAIDCLGVGADELCVFSRSHERALVLVIASRFPRRRQIRGGYGDTAARLPVEWQGKTFRDLLTGRHYSYDQAGRAAAVLEHLPAAVLVSISPCG